MPSVKLKNNEPVEALLRRFKRACEKAGILTELRRRETYEKPTTVKKRKKAAATKREMKNRLRNDPRLAKMHDRLRGGKGGKGGKGGRNR